MIHAVGIPMLQEFFESEDVPPGLFKGVPAKETVDNVIDAIGNITGKTLYAIKQHAQDDIKTEFYDSSSGEYRYGTPLAQLASNLRLKDMKEEAEKEDGHPEAKMLWTALQVYAAAHKCVKGVSSAKFMDCTTNMGAELKGFEFMQFLPSLDDMLNAEVSEDGTTWVEQFVRSFQGDDSKGQPDEEFMKKLAEEASEIGEVVKAAWAFRECFDMDFINEQTGGMASKAEDEAKKFFDI